MLTLPKRFRVPQAYRHPHFLLLPVNPTQAVVEFVAMLREREQLHQLFRPDDVWPSANFSLSQHEADLEWQHSEFLAKRSFAMVSGARRGSPSSGAVFTSTPRCCRRWRWSSSSGR